MLSTVYLVSLERCPGWSIYYLYYYGVSERCEYKTLGGPLAKKISYHRKDVSDI